MSVIYFLMGKSASGKDEISSALLSDEELELSAIVLYTTRPKREGEQNGKEYNFTDEKGLLELKTKGLVIEERVYQTVHGEWKYFTVYDEKISSVGDKNINKDFLTINTLEAYKKYIEYFGEEYVIPIYIEVRDDLRLIRAIERERQGRGDYKEMCRRFLADEDDFSEKNLNSVNIKYRFSNDGSPKECISAIKNKILELRGDR